MCDMRPTSSIAGVATVRFATPAQGHWKRLLSRLANAHLFDGFNNQPLSYSVAFGAVFVLLFALLFDLFFDGDFFMLFPVRPGEAAPLADVSPAPLETPVPVAPGAIVSAFVDPDDVDALFPPAFCASRSGAADTARQKTSCWAVRLKVISVSS
jgi:hypothetical protein